MAWGGGQQYGRWEGRVRAPASDPTYNALLLLWPDAENFPVGGEIDFMEMMDHTRQKTNVFLHYGEDNKQVSGSVVADATQWHNWAVEWTPTHVTTFLDGKEWWRTERAEILPPGPMHLCIQLDWFPKSSRSKVQTSTMQVDWVKQYAVTPEKEDPGSSGPRAPAADRAYPNAELRYLSAQLAPHPASCAFLPGELRVRARRVARSRPASCAFASRRVLRPCTRVVRSCTERVALLIPLDGDALVVRDDRVRSPFRSVHRDDLRDALALVAAIAVVGASFGALAAAGGVPPLMIIAMSVLVFAGGAQFLVVAVVTSGGSVVAAVVAGLPAERAAPAVRAGHR